MLTHLSGDLVSPGWAFLSNLWLSQMYIIGASMNYNVAVASGLVCLGSLFLPAWCQHPTVSLYVGSSGPGYTANSGWRLFSSYEAMLVDEGTYVCCKEFHAINIQAIGYHNMMIRHLIAKWPGSTLMLLSLKQGRILVKCHMYFKAFPTK